jgi:uncharacterized protein YkwD
MKIKAAGLLIIVCFLIVSCETLGINLGEIFTPSQSNSSNAVQSGKPIASGQPTRNANRRGDPDTANWDIAALDTAVDVDYLSLAEKDVILEMNKARADPKKYSELYIKPMLQYNWGGPFGANSYLAPGENVYTSTKEGKNGIQSCINDLSKRQNMSPLLPTEGLFLAAKDHVNDTGPKGITGHTGSDRSSMGQRINRYGKWDGGAGENISYGHNIGRDIVVQLIVDDGVSNRGHRNNILNKNFKYAGGASGNHSEFTYMCVIDYANGYTSNSTGGQTAAASGNRQGASTPAAAPSRPASPSQTTPPSRPASRPSTFVRRPMEYTKPQSYDEAYAYRTDSADQQIRRLTANIESLR